MRIQTRPSRPGISLLEVLTAIFIMGVGMLALLTLFPLGALSMARAVRDDRAAHIAANAASLAVAFDLRNDPHLNRPPDPTNPADKGEGFEHVDFRVTNNTLPSNPVFVDPYYARLASARPLGEVPGQTPGILRIAPTYVRNPDNTVNYPALTARWFTFQDEITFDTLGGAKGWPTGVERPGTYTIAYLVRRPRQDTRELVVLTVVVFASRNTDFFEREQTIWNGSLMGTAGQPQLSLNWQGPGVINSSGEKPDFRKGVWILDTSRLPLNAATNVVNGHFYRVESVMELGNQFQVELDRPLKADVNCIVVLSNVISVVERGTAWLP